MQPIDEYSFKVWLEEQGFKYSELKESLKQALYDEYYQDLKVNDK